MSVYSFALTRSFSTKCVCVCLSLGFLLSMVLTLCRVTTYNNFGDKVIYSRYTRWQVKFIILCLLLLFGLTCCKQIHERTIVTTYMRYCLSKNKILKRNDKIGARKRYALCFVREWWRKKWNMYSIVEYGFNCLLFFSSLWKVMIISMYTKISMALFTFLWQKIE